MMPFNATPEMQRSSEATGSGSPPVVSVVIIFLNAERFLEEAIQSVFAQTFQEWELLLVDDGSIDGSSARARRYAARHPGRIRYLEHPGHGNQGISASRNLGIRHSYAQYIAFLDADDVWMPTKLEQQVFILDSHPEVDLVYGAMLYWHSWAKGPNPAEQDQVRDLGMPLESVIPPRTLITRMLSREAAAPAMSSTLVRRAAALQIGLFEERFRGMHEDQAFVAKVSLRSPIYVSGRCWHRYRQHPESCLAVTTASGRRPAARRRFLRWLRSYLAEHGERGGELWGTVEKQLRPYRLTTRLRSRGQRTARAARESIVDLVRRVLPATSWLVGGSAPLSRPTPPIGRVRFGHLRRLTPISRKWGKDRGGLPIDRFYIERFLSAHASDIRGRVLEVQDANYTRRYGGDQVTHSDVLHAVPGNPAATMVADLGCAPEIPSDTFDCIILSQVLLCIEDVPSAVRTVHRILRPGGVALVTVPGISQIARHDMDRWGDYWRFTTLSARRLFERVFPADRVEVEAHGNVLAATAFLYGLASQELRPEELGHTDPDYQLLIAIRAVKPGPESLLSDCPAP
jgi:glycosyltransferase involved in cell wall biosynthesis/SAM-dependent methyltransferase